ncbi:MAG: molybdate ABC transporter substrate-binding protein [Alphaproteobacteria bacterium]
MRLLKFGGRWRFPAMLAGAFLGMSANAGAEPERITVYAAASLTDVIGAAAEVYTEKTGTEVRQVYAASSVIARQVAAGAPSDLVISANQRWMDFLERRNLLEPGTRRDIARNRLVAVVPADSPVTAKQGPELGRAWTPQRLAVGETAAVPAGIYAREALTALGRWETLRDSLVMAGSARVALAWVARGEVDAGLVYASDAAITPRVRRVWTVPEETHSPIRYPAAAVKGQRRGLEFLRFLTGEEGRRLFARHGFLPPGTG